MASLITYNLARSAECCPELDSATEPTEKMAEVSQTCGNMRAVARRAGAGGRKEINFCSSFIFMQSHIGLLDLVKVWRGGSLLPLLSVSGQYCMAWFFVEHFLSTFLSSRISSSCFYHT